MNTQYRHQQQAHRVPRKRARLGGINWRLILETLGLLMIGIWGLAFWLFVDSLLGG